MKKVALKAANGEIPYGSIDETFNLSKTPKQVGEEAKSLDGSTYILMKGCSNLVYGAAVLYDNNYNTVLAVSGGNVGTNYKGLAFYAGSTASPANSSDLGGYFLVKGSGEVSATGVTLGQQLYLSATPGVLSPTMLLATDSIPVVCTTNPVSNLVEVFSFDTMVPGSGSSSTIPDTVATGILTASNYALTYSSTAPTLTAGLEISFLPDANNPVGPITLDGVAVKKYTPTVTDLAAGDFQGGNAYSILWNGTNWVAQVGGATPSSYRVVQTLAAGNNILNHNLGYSDVLVTVRDGVTGEEVLVEVVAETSTTTTVKVLAAVVNAVITVK